MATRTARANTLEETLDEIQSRFKKAGKELQKIQKRAEKNRRDFQKRAEKRVEKAQKDFRKLTVVKRAEEISSGVRKQVESNMDSVMARMPLASNSEVKKLERKVAALTKKVRALEKAAATN